MNTYNSPTPHASTITFLMELRHRSLTYCVVLMAFVVLFFLFARDILYQLFTYPIASYVMYSRIKGRLDGMAHFTLSFKMALIAGLLVTMPLLLYQIGHFIFSGSHRLKGHQSGLVWLLSVVLFYVGISITYFTLFPFFLGFFKQQVLENMPVTLGLSYYLSFVLKLFFIFGLAFELPILIVLLVLSGLARLQKLKLFRWHVIIAFFALSLLFNPLNMISRLLFVLCLWLLFELGMGLARVLRSIFSCYRPG